MTPEEFKKLALQEQLEELRRQLQLVMRRLHRGYKYPRRSIEREFDTDDDLDEALSLYHDDDDEEEDY